MDTRSATEAITGVPERYVEKVDGVRRSRHGQIRCCSRVVVRNAGYGFRRLLPKGLFLGELCKRGGGDKAHFAHDLRRRV